MNTCVCCGAVIPEGRQVCPNCETWGAAPDAILPDGTHLYLKTTSQKDKTTRGYNLQNELYSMMFDYKRAVAMED